jgi:hypothetical protein
MIIIAGFFDGIIVLNPYGALFLILTCHHVVLLLSSVMHLQDLSWLEWSWLFPKDGFHSDRPT